jgi:hypothetical protein
VHPCYARSMPNQPATFNKTVRIEGDLWDRAGQIATVQGGTRASEINAFLRWYTGEPGAQLPEPATRDDASPRADVDRYIRSRLVELEELRGAAYAALDRGVSIDDILDHVEDAGRHIGAATTRVDRAG